MRRHCTGLNRLNHAAGCHAELKTPFAANAGGVVLHLDDLGISNICIYDKQIERQKGGLCKYEKIFNHAHPHRRLLCRS